MKINAEITISMQTHALIALTTARDKYITAIHNCQSDFLKQNLDAALNDVLKLMKIFDEAL